MRTFAYITLALATACVLLTGCADFYQEQRQALNNLRPYHGQKIETLEARLGPPDRKSEDTKNRLYVWRSARDISDVIYTEGMMGANGKPVHYNPDSPGLIKHERCIIAALTDLDDVILKTKYSGNDKGECMALFDKLKNPDKQASYPLFP